MASVVGTVSRYQAGTKPEELERQKSTRQELLDRFQAKLAPTVNTPTLEETCTSPLPTA